MKTIIAARLLFITATLGSTTIFGMESKNQEAYVPKRAATLMPTARDTFLQETTTSSSSSMLSSAQARQIKQTTLIKRQQLYALFYDLITTMPPELINIILDYYSKEFYGKLQQTISVKTNTHTLLEVDPKTIATYSHQYITFFEKSTGKHLKNVPMSGCTKVIKVDHAILAFGCRQTTPNTLRLLPWTEEKSVGKTIQAHDTTMLDCALTPEKNVVTVTDNEIKLWQSTGEYIKTVPIHSDSILLTPLSETFIATGSDKRIDIWSLEDGTLQKTVNLEKYLENDDPLSTLIALDEETLIIASNDHVGMVKWRQENPISLMTKLQKPIRALTVLPLANALATGYEDGTIELYSSETLAFLKSFKATGPIINLIALAEGLQCASLASCNAQRQNEAIQIWE